MNFAIKEICRSHVERSGTATRPIKSGTIDFMVCLLRSEFADDETGDALYAECDLTLMSNAIMDSGILPDQGSAYPIVEGCGDEDFLFQMTRIFPIDKEGTDCDEEGNCCVCYRAEYKTNVIEQDDSAGDGCVPEEWCAKFNPGSTTLIDRVARCIEFLGGFEINDDCEPNAPPVAINNDCFEMAIGKQIIQPKNSVGDFIADNPLREIVANPRFGFTVFKSFFDKSILYYNGTCLKFGINLTAEHCGVDVYLEPGRTRIYIDSPVKKESACVEGKYYYEYTIWFECNSQHEVDMENLGLRQCKDACEGAVIKHEHIKQGTVPTKITQPVMLDLDGHAIPEDDKTTSYAMRYGLVCDPAMAVFSFLLPAKVVGVPV